MTDTCRYCGSGQLMDEWTTDGVPLWQCEACRKVMRKPEPALAILRRWVERRALADGGPDDGVKSYLAGFFAGGTSDARETLVEIDRLATKLRVIEGAWPAGAITEDEHRAIQSARRVYVVTEEP